MGKNQTHKALQKGRSGGAVGGADDEAHGVDASFHSADWHAARLAALTVERPSYEDWKQKQKEAAALEIAALEEQDRQMREYKEGLAADRAKKLGLIDAGVKKPSRDKKKHKKHKKSSKEKKHKKDKKHHKKHKKHKKKKHSRHSSSSSSSSSGTSSSSSSDSDSDTGKKVGKDADGDEGHGPVRLSEYLWGGH